MFLYGGLECVLLHVSWFHLHYYSLDWHRPIHGLFRLRLGVLSSLLSSVGVTLMSASIFDGVDLSEVEIDNQHFFETGYECEVYYDVYAWNPARTDRTTDIIWAGSTVCPIPFIDENEYLDKSKWAAVIRAEIQKALDDEDRIGPVYVTC